MSSARNAPSRIVVIAGSSSTVEASTSRPTRAPSSRSQTGREQARVEREEAGAGEVEQPLGAPDLPADPRRAPGRCPRSTPRPRRRTSATTSTPRARNRRASVAGTSAARARRKRLRQSDRGPRDDQCERRPPPRREASDRQQRRARPTTAPYAATQRGAPRRPLGGPPGAGLADAGGGRAGPAPGRRAPGRRRRTRARPSAFLPIRAPGSSVLRTPTVLPGADADRADPHDVAVDPVARRGRPRARSRRRGRCAACRSPAAARAGRRRGRSGRRALGRSS